MHDDQVGRLLILLREVVVVVLADILLGRDDGDVLGVHNVDDAEDHGHGLEPGDDGGEGVRPADGHRQEDSGEHNVDLEDDVVAGGDAEVEAVGDLMEGLASGEVQEALAHGDGYSQRCVLLEDGRS